jgi:hypothetical protein
MTTYASTNFQTPAVALVGEIEFPDGTKYLVPAIEQHDWREIRLDDAYVISQDITALTETQHTLPVGYIPASDCVTVMKGPEIVRTARARRERVPVWSVASMFAGTVLMAMGWGFNAPIVQWVWSALHGG